MQWYFKKMNFVAAIKTQLTLAMKNNIQSILILGGTGRTGSQLINRALQKGFRVTALVRHPEKLNKLSLHPNIEILKGDVLNYPDVYNAVQGNDAIISALGRDGKKVEVLTKGTANIMRAMAQSSVQKFICLSSLGAGSTKKLASWKLKWVIRLAGLRHSFEAKAEQEIMLYQSPLDFTLVMAGSFSNKTKYKNASAFTVQQAPCMIGLNSKVSRQTVANFMLDQLFSDVWKRKSVCLVDEC